MSTNNIVPQTPAQLQASANNAPADTNQAIDEFFALIETILPSLVARLGPFVVALMPSLFTGYSVYETLYQKAGAELAFIFALAVAVAIECAGIYLGHNAVRISGWGWLLAGLYVLGVWGIVVFGHAAFSGLSLGIGLFSPVLVLSVYISHALFLQKDTALRQEWAEAIRQRKRQDHQQETPHVRMIPGACSTFDGVELQAGGVDLFGLDRDLEQLRRLLVLDLDRGHGAVLP